MNLFECLLKRMSKLEEKINNLQKTLVILFKCLAALQRARSRKKSLNANAENITPFDTKPSSSFKKKSRSEIDDDRQPLKKAKMSIPNA